jgi:hypothetical protein
MVYGQMAYNRTVTASPSSMRLGLRRIAVGLTLFARFFSAIFFLRPQKCFAFFIGRKKRQLRSERYAPLFFELVDINY